MFDLYPYQSPCSKMESQIIRSWQFFLFPKSAAILFLVIQSMNWGEVATNYPDLSMSEDRTPPEKQGCSSFSKSSKSDWLENPVASQSYPHDGFRTPCSSHEQYSKLDNEATNVILLVMVSHVSYQLCPVYPILLPPKRWLENHFHAKIYRTLSKHTLS